MRTAAGQMRDAPPMGDRSRRPDPHEFEAIEDAERNKAAKQPRDAAA
jgi:hypothetical protein